MMKLRVSNRVGHWVSDDRTADFEVLIQGSLCLAVLLMVLAAKIFPLGALLLFWTQVLL